MNSTKAGFFCCLIICADNRWKVAQLVPMFFTGSQPPNPIIFVLVVYSLGLMEGNKKQFKLHQPFITQNLAASNVEKD
jgi:hypothetical protein